jgi:hypothetical protein
MQYIAHNSQIWFLYFKLNLNVKCGKMEVYAQAKQQPTGDGLQNPEKASGNRTLQILHTHTSGGQCLRQQHTNKDLLLSAGFTIVLRCAGLWCFG